MEGDQRHRGNYLSIDGGTSGLPALFILEEMLLRMEFDLKSDNELLPWQHFDIIIGTGPGGLVAILIGRLRMSPSMAIEAYMKLVRVLPTEPAKDDDERKRNTEKFKAAFKEALKEAGFEPNAPMLDDNGVKVVVCTSNTSNLAVVHPIRSFRTRSAQTPACTVLEAVCACVSSPDMFIPVSVGTGHKQVTLVDAMAVAANPGKVLLGEAQRIFGEDAEVATIISIGAGKGDVWSMSTSGTELKEAVKRAAASCEPVHEELYAQLRKTGIYFRLNVERGSNPQLELSSAVVSAYLGEGVVSDRLDDAINSIRDRSSGVKLKDINSVTVIEIALKPRPSLVQNFIGRDDILRSMRCTHITNRAPNLRTPAITVLSGLGGSGKTQTALKFALDFEELYANTRVYFLNASSEANLRADLETLIRSLGSGYHTKSFEDALQWLATKIKHWLVILDNADDPKFLIFPYIPKCTHGNIIITTRNSTLFALAPNSSHHLEGLSTEDAIDLILTASQNEKNEINWALARAIVLELGHFPLALAQAAGYILIHKCLNRYLIIYRVSKRELLDSFETEQPQDYQVPVATTIRVSLKQLPPAAQQLLRLFAHLDSTSISQEIISKSASSAFRKVMSTAESELQPETLDQAIALMKIFCPSGSWSEYEFNNLVTQCLQYSLLRVTTQGDSRFYSMHILVQSHLRASLDPMNGYKPGQLTVRFLGSAITFDSTKKFIAFHRLLLPHLRLIRVEDVVEAGDHRAFRHVLNHTGDDRLAVTHIERCVEMWRASLGDEHQNTLWAMMALAVSYKHTGSHHRAMEIEMKVWDVHRRVLGPEHLDTLSAARNLAESYRRLGRYEEAVKLNKQVLEARGRLLGPDNQGTVTTMANLALCYNSLGRNQESLELQERVLEFRKRLLGPEDPNTLWIMGCLAESYFRVNRSQEALELTRQTLEAKTRVFGPEHRQTLATTRVQLLILRKLGMKDQIPDLLRMGLSAHEKALGINHPRTMWLKEKFGAELASLKRTQTMR